MKKQAGFTLIELMVVIAILGIMAATAAPLYHTYQQRAYGSEAAVMMKRIIDAQIMYFLEHDTFFPENKTHIVTNSGLSAPAGAIDEIREAMNVHIPVGHRLDFTITGTASLCIVVIPSPFNSFPLFANGDTFIRAMLDKTGKIDIL